MTINVADVATDADLCGYVLGQSNLNDLVPDEWIVSSVRVATIARQRALDTVLLSLARRRPPIRDYELADVSELKQAVCYGALEILYSGSIQHAESPNVGRAKRYGQLFREEREALQPTVTRGLVSASSLSVRVSRG